MKLVILVEKDYSRNSQNGQSTKMLCLENYPPPPHTVYQHEVLLHKVMRKKLAKRHRKQNAHSHQSIS